ncbi:MAG: hypothetical protein PHF25_01220 [Candidatus Margulisbacteria bacterium]|nr:hypothetical protein [Candidatus Margulisiibacteriota bacterium]
MSGFINADSAFKSNDSKQSLLITNRNEKYYLGDRKTFMKTLEGTINKITLDLADPAVESMTIDGQLIEDKNSAGSLFFINTKLNELKDLSRTLVSSFDFLKEIEKEVSRLIS